MNNIQLITSAGPVNFISLSSFGNHIPIEKIHTDTAYTILPVNPTESFNYSDFPDDDVSVRRVEIKPKLLLSINNHALMASNINHMEMLQNAICKFITNEVTNIALKTKQSFIVTDLSMDKIQCLSDEAMCKSMIENAVAFTVVINDFSKFLVITSSNAFKVYLSDEKVNRINNTIDWNAAFLFTRPDMFVMGKYDNPTYLMELTGKNRVI